MQLTLKTVNEVTLPNVYTLRTSSIYLSPSFTRTENIPVMCNIIEWIYESPTSDRIPTADTGVPLCMTFFHKQDIL